MFSVAQKRSIIELREVLSTSHNLYNQTTFIILFFGLYIIMIMNIVQNVKPKRVISIIIIFDINVAKRDSPYYGVVKKLFLVKVESVFER